MKQAKKPGHTDLINKTLFRHIQSELSKLDVDEVKKLREDSETNALLVEAIKNSMKGAK